MDEAASAVSAAEPVPAVLVVSAEPEDPVGLAVSVALAGLENPAALVVSVALAELEGPAVLAVREDPAVVLA